MSIDINSLPPWAQKQIADKVARQMREKSENLASNGGKGKSKYKNIPAERSGEIELVIAIPPITKKNSQRLVPRGNRVIPIPSEQYEAYQENAGQFIPPSARIEINAPSEITCLFYMKTRRRVDLTNLLEAIDDTLVHYGVIEDDNSKIVVSHDGSRVLYDKENPRTEIVIRRVKKCD